MDSPSIKTLDACISRKITSYSTDSTKYIKRLEFIINFIIETGYPTAMVDHQSFKMMQQTFDPKYRAISRDGPRSDHSQRRAKQLQLISLAAVNMTRLCSWLPTTHRVTFSDPPVQPPLEVATTPCLCSQRQHQPLDRVQCPILCRLLNTHNRFHNRPPGNRCRITLSHHVATCRGKHALLGFCHAESIIFLLW